MEQFLESNWWLIVMLSIWSVAWKGVALWKAARLGQKGWFVALLVVNLAGLLEILYIFVFSKKPAPTQIATSQK